MSHTIADFTTRFPEYKNTDPIYVQSALDDAELLISETAFGTLYDLAIMYHAAHRLAVSPFGQQNAVDNANDGDTIYSIYYKRHIIPRTGRRGLLL